jgi:hypothetical protein
MIAAPWTPSMQYQCVFAPTQRQFCARGQHLTTGQQVAIDRSPPTLEGGNQQTAQAKSDQRHKIIDAQPTESCERWPPAFDIGGRCDHQAMPAAASPVKVFKARCRARRRLRWHAKQSRSLKDWLNAVAADQG